MTHTTQVDNNNTTSNTAPFASVADYVQKLGGSKVIESILIANNGIAAVKCIRSIRKWAYEMFGNERAIKFVAMATPEDLRVNAEFIRLADVVEEVPGGSNINNYANVDLIVEIAERRGVQGVWAGWGHASEFPRLPDSLSKTKTQIAFLGPPASAMHDLGDKIASTIIAQSANVNCVEWSGQGVTVNYSEHGIPENIYQKCCVSTVEEAAASIKKIGFPCMIKASEGGGGKGIRKVTSEEELETAFRQVQGEVPGSPIFIMKMLSHCRHLEVQVLADKHGNAIALYGRDCSIQRRHQKIIEEGPAIIAPEGIRIQMEEAATRMAAMVGYQGVGTVEYLYSPAANQYYFLELNPRLQVEHPVTELITDVNLPACQLNVAMGVPLGRIPDIRRFYGEAPFTTTPVILDTAHRRPPKGHAVAVRITGENPTEGFKPTSGGITELTFRSAPRVWGYFSVGASGGLHEFADSQFGHIFAHGDDREKARRELVIALKELSIRGEISTPVTYVSALMESSEFKANEFSTHWLDGLISNATQLEKKPNAWHVVLCGGLFKAYTDCAERHKQFMAYLERGQIPPKELLKLEDTVDLIYHNTKYTLVLNRTSPQTFSVQLKGKPERLDAFIRPLADGGYLIYLDGASHLCYGTVTMSGLKLLLNGRTCLFTSEYDPTKLRTSTAGKLVRYLVDNGAHVKKGTAYAEMEVMKMYLPLITTESGRITHLKPEGSVLEPGVVIATLQLDDPSAVVGTKLYEGSLPNLHPPHVKGQKPHQLLREAMAGLNGVLQGYYHTNINGAIDVLLEQLKNPAVPLLEFKDCFSCCAVKLPKQVADGVTVELDKYSKALEAKTSSLPNLGGQIKNVIDTYLASVPVVKQNEFKNVGQTLVDLATQYTEGMEKYAEKTIRHFFEEYYSVEKVYQLPRDEVIERERQTHKEDLKKVLEFELSHMNKPLKTKMIIALLDRISQSHFQVQPFQAVLTNLSDLVGTEHHEVSLRSRQTLIRYAYPSFAQRKEAMERELLEKKFDAIAARPQSVFDVLSYFLTHQNVDLRKHGLEAYIRRAYKVYEIESFTVSDKDGITKAEWTYNPPFGVDAHTGSASASMMPMVRAESDDNLAALTASLENDLFSGFAFVLLGEISSKFSEALQTILASANSPANAKRTGYYNIFQIIISKSHSSEPWMNSDESISQHFASFFGQFAEKLRQARVRRVTLLVIDEGKFPSTFTFRERLGYKEHYVYRHIEPPLAFDLELTRLSNYEIRFLPTENKQIHLYYAEEKTAAANRRNRHTCLFARAVIRGGETKLASGPTPSLAEEAEEIITEAENVLNAACNALEIAKGDNNYRNTWHNHIFMKFVAEVSIDAEKLFTVINGMARKYEKRLGRLQVGQVELLGKIKRPNTPNATTMRFIITNPTTYRFDIDAYLELKDLKTKKVLLTPVSGSGKLDGHENLEPYIPPAAIARKRTLAHANNTSYVYDYLELFEAAVKMEWEKFLSARNRPTNSLPKKLVEATEFVLNSADQLEQVKREAGLNDIGMVAWLLRLYTPEYPDGRPIVLIANDISFQSGSFGVREDVLYKKASEFAREKRIPRLYIAANSGARIGLAQEVMKQFHVAWVNPENPQKGFKYLYVTDEEYKTLGPQKSVNAKKLEDGTWMITDIIGMEDGLGVENLRGSGMIAGETSRAYDETFTLSYVTGRSVGIGAYIVRLGQRTIQDKGPIILTGAQALNKVLGRRVYASNHQLGGPQIMYPNGVTHLTVSDTMAGVVQMVHWLSYVPRECGVPLPILPAVDPIERQIDFVPTKSPYDVRHMLAGHSADGNWVSGFFDQGSFTEYLGGWAKTVVTGRAKLGGIPMGVIAVETRTVFQVKPADPAAADSHEENIPQAGQVWFPDSAYKTAQAIQDFNRGEELPLMIFANWRGFSGGLRDLFQEILKFGSYIVDALRTYKQPIFIYLPPAAELRGGAWVVVDPTINEEMMEMYSDENARGGILEPEGTIEIKYKREEVLATIHRLDEKIQEWDKALIQANINLKADEAAEIQKKIAAREMELVAVYERVASHFADLHDTPGRMKAKGVIRECVPWKTAREYFYFRVKRRLAQEALKKSIQKAQPGTDSKQALLVIRDWLQSSYPERNIATLWEDDKFIINWMERDHDIIQQSLNNLRSKGITEQVISLGKMDPQAALTGFAKLLESLTPEQRSSLDLSKLKKVL